MRRIIPARAGFTTRRTCTGPGMPDHPRSRGVYIQYNRTFMTHRIIPARAGFTYMDDKVTDEIADHPRSRGVYSHTKHPFVG